MNWSYDWWRPRWNWNEIEPPGTADGVSKLDGRLHATTNVMWLIPALCIAKHTREWRCGITQLPVRHFLNIGGAGIAWNSLLEIVIGLLLRINSKPFIVS